MFFVRTATAEDFRLKVQLNFVQQVASGAIVIYTDSGSGTAPSRTFPITSATTKIGLDLGSTPFPDGSRYAFVYGEIVDGNQEPTGFIPVHAIDIANQPRQDLVETSLIVFASPDDAFEASFPLVPSFRDSLDRTDMSAVLQGLKILLLMDMIRSDIQWQRVTSDILLNLPSRLTADSSKAGSAMQFLDQFVEIAGDEKYDRFYVEFLLRLKQAQVGGIPLGSGQTLDEFIFASIEKMFSRKIGSTFSWSANAVTVFREQSNEDNSADCVRLSVTVANAVSGAIEAGSIDASPGRSESNETLSLLQKMTECAQQYYVNTSSKKDASRNDVEGAVNFLKIDEFGEGFVLQYIRLFESLESRGNFPRHPTDSLAARRSEIAKYYEWLVRTQ